MRIKRRILLAILLASVLAAFAWFVLRSNPAEPVYEGDSLSVWLKRATRSSNYNIERSGAEVAIRQIGTNAIPTLLRMLQEKDSPFTVKVQGLIFRYRLTRNIIVSATERNSWAEIGFQILGPAGESAVPALIEILNNNESEFIRAQAAAALGGIGPPAKQAVPALIRSLTAVDRPANDFAPSALGEIHAEPSVAIPILLACIANTNRFISLSAVHAIGKFGPDAQEAIPRLISEASNATSRLRFDAMRTLGKIHARPEVVVPFLASLLTNINSGARGSAAEGLGSFGADAKPVLTNILELAKDTDSGVRRSALEAASHIDSHNSNVVRAMSHGLSDTNNSVRYTAAEGLLEAGPFAQAAVPDLIKALQPKYQDPAFQAMAAAALKKIDPAAAVKEGIY